MSSLFPRWANVVPFILVILLVGGVAGATFVVSYWFSPYHLNVGYQPDQPIPFSHKLHAGELGLDCRYCHNHIEKADHANVPSTQTCMNCHSQVKTESKKLAKVRDSFAKNEPIEWTYIHKLPDYAYFSHQAHLAVGVGCKSCHGRIDQMDVVKQSKPLSMQWCLDCHRQPENHLIPKNQVTNLDFQHDPALGQKIKDEKSINPPLHCSGCHR